MRPLKLWSLISLNICHPRRPGAHHRHRAKIGSGRLGRLDLGSNSLGFLLTPQQIGVDRLGMAQVVGDDGIYVSKLEPVITLDNALGTGTVWNA